MVNSSSYDDLSSQHQTQDRNAKAEFKQPYNVSSESKHPSSPCNKSFSETADTDLPSDAFAIEPIPTKTEFNSDMSNENNTNIEKKPENLQVSAITDDLNASSICCSLPLDKVQGVLTRFHQPKPDEETPKSKITRKLLCLYCDRSFVSVNLRQKHVERVHSVKQNRRMSSRRQNQQLTVTPCVYCDKLNSTEKTLKDLFHHLVSEHSNKYFGCLPCEQRFLAASHLTDHNVLKHELPIPETTPKLEVSSTSTPKITIKSHPPEDLIQIGESSTEEIPVKVTRSKTKPKFEEPTVSDTEKIKKFVTKKKSVKLKEFMNKKLSVKSSRITNKRRESKRIQAITKLTDTPKRKRNKPSEKKPSTVKSKFEQHDSTNTTEKSTKLVSTCINPYPEFDCFYRVKKITDHSIDNLKISSLTFDDVFDKAFFNRIKCNIEENLLHHIDGKLFKNEESENRISNFEKISNFPQETQNSSSENYGCEISLNAVTPVASLSLNSQFGEDFESQIEYGSKPSKKKNQTKTDEVVHYKYFTRRKFQASILQHKENRDLSKLDMWTQLKIKKRQQKMLDDKKSAKEIQEYTAGDEYKSRIKREELNRILDRRGPFEDLKEEASKKVALDKLNLDSEDSISHESFSEVREVLNEILNRVFEATECVENAVEEVVEKTVSVRVDLREIPSYLNLRRSSFTYDEIDRSDKITLICSSQETENFELPTNQVRGKNEIIELSGEWARCRMYICAACGAKLPNMKYLMEHKSLYHQNVWVQHYEFVGNQSELYRHLSIPALGKVGAVEESVPCKVWKRSDARICTKCGKQCNSLGELHRHILECGGDWTWMLARKKCKYRPFGTKSRRKRRGLVHRVHIKRKTEPTEKKKYKKTLEGPRQRPSDADSIQRMLANLPAKRSTRKLISLQDGIYRSRKKTQIGTSLNKKNKVKCGKVIYKSNNIKETTEKTLNTTRVNLSNTSQKNSSSTNRRTLRSLNKVLASRIIDSNPKLTVKRKLRVINDKRRTRKCEFVTQQENEETQSNNCKETSEPTENVSKTKNPQKCNIEDESLEKRSSLRSQGKSLKKISMKQLLTGKINIKSFFPIKKRKNKKNVTELETEPGTSTEDILTRSKANNHDVAEVPKLDDSDNNFEKTKTINNNVRKDPKKIKKETFGKLVKSFSMRRKNHNSSKDSISKDESTNKEKLTAKKNINEDNTNKKRKLKQNFRNVINRVKKLKIDNECPSSSTMIPIEKIEEENQISQNDAFLDESKQNDKLDPCAPPEKIVIPSILEVRENLADISETAIVMTFNEIDDDPHIPERIFRLESNNEKSLQAKGELNFDTQPASTPSEETGFLPPANDKNFPGITQKVSDMQPISIETSVKPKVVPLISPNMKGKIRKPTRGLNDCIAMLTSKLKQKTEQTESKNKTLNKTESCNNLSHSANIFRPFTEVSVPKPDCILKIPNFKTHFSGMEETALDLSMKSQSNPELNRTPQHETFWQTRKPNFLLPADYVKTIWVPPTPLLKSSSVEQTIEEVIEKGYQEQNELQSPLKSHIRWNSVDRIIQNVIDGYKDIPAETEYKKNLTAKNTIDDIIEFVIASSTIDGKKCELLFKEDENGDNFTISKQELLVNNYETSILTNDEKEIIQILPQEEIPCKNNIEIKRKRTKRKTKGKTNNETLKIQKKPLPVEEQSTKWESLPAHNKLSEKVRNITVPDNTNKLTKSNEELNASHLLDNTERNQEPLSLDTAFIQYTENKITGNNLSSRKVRKIGQIRKDSLKKKNTKGKVLETNVDNLLNFEEVSKSNVSVTNLGMVSTGEVQEPEIKLTTEDEPHLLENKALLSKKKSITPSDSEDEIPLSVLRQTENNDEKVVLIRKLEEEKSELREPEPKIPEGNTSKISVQENIEHTLNQTIEIIPAKPVEKDIADEREIIVKRDVTLKKSVQLDETDEKIPLCGEEKILGNEYKNTKELQVINLADTHIAIEVNSKIVLNGTRNIDQETVCLTELIKNNEEIEEVYSKEIADNDTSSSENSTSLINEPRSKPFLNVVVFKTPKKVRKFTRKQGSKKRSVGRKMKLVPKCSVSGGDLSITDNSEADTDDESLLSLKMSLKLNRSITESVSNTEKLPEMLIGENPGKTVDNIDIAIENRFPANCTEKSVSSNEKCKEGFSLLDQNKSNGAISSTVLPQVTVLQTNEDSVHVEKDREEECFETTSQNGNSLILDKSDANNFFDSGISDESLENVDQREKVSLPKKRAKKSKLNRTTSKSSQVSIREATDDSNRDDSILNDENSFNISERSTRKDDLGETQNELLGKRRCSRKRQSEMELSDSSNSISDITNDKTSEVRSIIDDKSIITSSPTLVVGKHNTNIEITENMSDYKNDNESKETKTSAADFNYMKEGVISDVTVIINNKKELDYLIPFDQTAVKSENVLNLNDVRISKTKTLKAKARFRKRNSKNCKVKMKESKLNKKIETMDGDSSEIIPSSQGEFALGNLKEIKIKQLTVEKSTTNLKTGNLEASPTLTEPIDSQGISSSVTKIIRRSKSVKHLKTSPNNSSSKRSSSVPSAELSAKTTSENSDKCMDEAIRSGTLRKSRTSLKHSSKFSTPEIIILNKPENNVESVEKKIHGDLSGRRPRSAKNKVVNYSENDINENTDSSSLQDITSENSPKKVITEIKYSLNNRPKSTERKLKMLTDTLEIGQSDTVTENALDEINRSPIDKKNLLNNKAKIVTMKQKLRKRRTKRKEKLLRKTRNNNKFNKQDKQKFSKEIHENLSILEGLAETTKEEISREGSLKASSEGIDVFTDFVKTNENICDSVESSEKKLENNQKLTVTNTPNVVTHIPDNLKEPPIKIIINKQKTRRKSKSFRKIDNKGQNDLFKDFALVIKKNKRQAPIITFTPTDSILKETYPNLVTTSVESVVENKPEDQKTSDDNLNESVEEMDMELDEIPITTNIIERNALPEVNNDVNNSTETLNSNNDLKSNANRVKCRKVKSKKARFTKKKSRVTVNTDRGRPQIKIAEINNLEKAKYSLNSGPKLSDTVENDVLKPPNVGSKQKYNSHTDLLKPECVSIHIDKEFSGQVQTENEERFDNKNTKEDIDKLDDIFMVSSCEIAPEKRILRIKKTVTGRKAKRKTIRKKLVINFNKNKKNKVNINPECSGLDQKKLELLNKESVINNLLSPKENEYQIEVINEIVPVPTDEKDSLFNNLETEESNIQQTVVQNTLDSGRKLRKSQGSVEISSKPIQNKPHSDNLKNKVQVCESVQKLFETEPPLIESTLTPIKINITSLLPIKPVEEKDLESIYTFDESEDFHIEKPIEISIRLPRKKDFSLSEPVELLQNNNIFENSKELDNSSKTQTSERRLPKKKGTSFSEPDLLHKNNLTEISKEVDYDSEEQISEKSNGEKSTFLSESLDTFESARAVKTVNDISPSKPVNISDFAEIETNKSEENSMSNLKPSIEKNGNDKQNNSEYVVIQENKMEPEDNTRRKSMRNAKVKALEHIHDEALAELTESERNRELNRSKTVPQEEIDVTTNTKKNVNKKIKKNQKAPKLLQTLDFEDKILVEDKPPSFADLVADLAGLEELENSIERELNAADDNFVRGEQQNDLEFTTKLPPQENEGGLNDLAEQDSQELRRSRRGSRKIASYNENDLIDPILDIVDRKKKNRRKDLLDNISQDEMKCKKTIDEVKKLNCDELFDLLKSTENEQSSSKTQNSFAGTVHNLPENSILPDKHKVSDFNSQINNEKVTDKSNSRDPEKIYEFTESPENIEQISFPHINVSRKSNKIVVNRNFSMEKTLSEDNVDNSTSSTSFQETALLENPKNDSKSTKTGVEKPNYCEICNKSFIRIENLIKHKRTLTHIQKLSELEAKQAKEKFQLHQFPNQEESELISEESPIIFESSLSDINIHNILLKSEKPKEMISQMVHSSFPNNDSLKLADIISDVLNKPSLASVNDDDSNFIDSQNPNETQLELKRYKSLGERKSFDSDNVLNTDHNSLPISEPYLSKTTILEKQISLLENIIDNQTGVSYIDDISMSSNNSAVENFEFSSKQDDSNNPLSKDKTVMLNNMENSFLKPTQYEEISEDSVNVRHYEDQKLRKTLNRDEELFLECCSLLKSGSEVSSYSNQRSQKIMNRLGVKQFDEPESMENKNLVRESDYNLENDYSDGNSRIPTPLGDSYDDDASDSNTISSNWDINKMEPVFDDNPNVTSNLNFQEVLNKAIHQEKVEIHGNFRKSPEKEEFETSSNGNKREEISDISTNKKKIITKGARKVFEGLKVSIPTEEINLEEVLNCSPKCKKVELQFLQSVSDDQSISEIISSPQKPSRNARKSKPVKKAQVGSNLLFKVKKKKTLLSPGNIANTNQEKDSTKSIDVYDFEETQDNTDVFPKPDFRAFRSKKSNENMTELESDTESRDDYLEPFIGQPESITSSLSSSSSIRKSKAHESITKKKCMIMGRIFKNQAKSKIEDIDEEMRDIPIIDNDELVEKYVANCKIIKNEMKPKLSETEINQLFDQLLETKDNEKDDNCDTLAKGTSKLKPEYLKDKEKKLSDNKKKKMRSRKRARTNSESTDDEFNLNKSTKRVYRKNGKAEDNSINLEQELKECIGVASRKSQRKCTSGKQNVLVEYWSSDESQFEALLETQRIDHKSKQQPRIAETKETKPPESFAVEKNVSIIKSNTEFEKIPTILKPPPRPKTKKSQSKRKHSGDKDKTINLNVTINSSKTADPAGVNRRKRAAANPLYHWSSSSEDESQDLIEIKPIREDEEEFEDDRPIQHGWIVGESPKKLVTMLAQAKGKKLIDVDCVKEQGKKRTNNSNS